MTSSQLPVLPAGEPDTQAPMDEATKVATDALENGGGIDRLTQLATGNTHLVTRPGLMNAIFNSNATPEQTDLINQFMATLDAQQQVEDARASGSTTPIVLSDYQTQALDSLGIQYNDVAQSSSMAQAAYQSDLASRGLQIAHDQNGNVLLNSDGTPQVEQMAKAKKSSGWSFGRIAGDVLGGFVKIGNVSDDLASSFASYDAQIASDVGAGIGSLVGEKNVPTLHKVDSSSQQNLYERAAGFNPNSFTSNLEYMASGQDHLALTPYANQWDKNYAQTTGINGQSAVIMAIQYLNNPTRFRQAIEMGPGTTDQKAQKLETLFGNDQNGGKTPFTDLIRQVGGSTATMGNVAARTLGLDPVKHPELYSITSAGLDFGSQLALDPLMVLGRVNKADKLFQLGIQDAQDSTDYAKVQAFFRDMSLADKLRYPRVALAQRRWQDFIDQTNIIADVAAKGEDATTADRAAMVAAQRKIFTAHPDLAPLTEDFTGAHRLVIDEEGKVLQDANGDLLRSAGTPIRTMQEAGDYLGSKMVISKLVQGRAGMEAPYMPGATSMFGLRALKGNLAAMSARAGVKINLRNINSATSVLANAGEAILTDGTVQAADDALTRARMIFSAANETTDSSANIAGLEQGYSDAVKQAGITALTAAKASLSGATGEIIGHHIDSAIQDIEAGKDPFQAITEAQKASESDWALKGVVQNNLLKTGKPSAGQRSFIGYFNPVSAVAKRSARVGELWRRLTVMLPRNERITLGDAASAEKISKFMQLYANKADANLAAALWNSGNEGVRRNILKGIQLQVAHAAGWGSTDSGRQALKEMQRLFGDTTADVMDAAKPETELYSPAAAGGLDTINDPQLGGRLAHHALFQGQVNETWTLPTFSSLRQSAERFGIYDRTFGRAFNSTIADMAMHGMKLLQLLSPKTWTRAALEGWSDAAFRGQAVGGWRAGVLARMIDRQSEADIRAQAAAENWSKKALQEKLDEALVLPKRGPLATAGRATARGVAAPLVKRGFLPHIVQGRWYNAVIGKMFNEDDPYTQYLMRYLRDPAYNRAAMEGLSDAMIHAEMSAGSGERLAISRDGFPAKELKFRPKDLGVEMGPWEDAATSGEAGARHYENALGMRLEYFPEYGKALLNAARPGGTGDITELKRLIAEDPAIAKRTQQMRLTGVVTDADGRTREAITDADKELATEQFIRKQVADVKYHLQTANGQWIQKVDDYFMEHGKVPDSNWLMHNLANDERPATAVAPTWIAKVDDTSPSGFINKMFQALDHGYKRMVEDPARRTTTTPLYAHYYAQTRTELMNMESRLIGDHGFTPEAAEKIVHNMAVRGAWHKIEMTVDDPASRSQLNIVGRNFLMYSRAAEAMIRRWGNVFVQDPTRIVKLALGVQAAEHSGMVWQDANGEWNFSYPSFAPFINLFNEATGKIPFLKNWLQLPTTDLTGKVLLGVPGVSQALNTNGSIGGVLGATGGLSPMVNTPFRLIQNFIGTHPGLDPNVNGSKLATLMAEFDQAVNGPIGAGQIGAQFEPALFTKWAQAFEPSTQNGMLASATMGALTNYLAAHGKDMASFSQMTTDQQQQLIDNIQAQVRNQLRVRAALGMYLPSAPSAPQFQSGNPADFEFAITGTHGLSDEFKQMINDYNGDYGQALQMWTALHPDKLVYAQATSGTLANKAYMPATLQSLTWAENNAPFIGKYKSIAGYFMPQTQGDFNPVAYRMQLALGLRSKDTPLQFLQTAIVRATYPEYDQWMNDFKNASAQATQSGDDTLAAQINKAQATWRSQFLDLNPTFKNYMGAEQAVTTNEAQNALSELRQMVSDNSIPADINKTAVSQMLSAWDQYSQFKTANPANTQAGKDMRTIAAAAFQQYMTGVVQNAPELTDLYNGVFRRLDSKLVDLSANN